MTVRAESSPRVPVSGVHRRGVPWAVAATALLLSLNLRPAVTSVAAAFPALAATFGPVYAPGSPWLAALGSAPILAFGLSAPLGPWLARRWGLGTALTTAMLALAAALALRVAQPALLLPGTVLAGCAIMVASVLVPQLVKESGGATWLSGLTTMGMGTGAAIGAALLTPTASWWGLPGGLAAWAFPALAAGAVAWGTLRAKHPRHAETVQLATRQFPAVHARAAAPSSSACEANAPAHATAPSSSLDHPTQLRRSHVHRNRTAIAITAYFGVQALLYFAVTSWLPTFLADRGASAATASGLLAWFSVAGLPASFAIPVIVGRRRGARVAGPAIGLAIAACLVWVLLGPLSLMPLAIAALGLAQASTLAFAFTLIVIRSHDAAVAGRLSALAQGAGFALASVGPFAAGWVHGVTGGWAAPFVGMAAFALVLAALGAVAVRGPEVR